MNNHETTYWCCLITVERDGRFDLIYGYAINVIENPMPSWKQSEVFDQIGVHVVRFIRFLSEAELARLAEDFTSGETTLATSKGTVVIRSRELLRRPPVYALPRELVVSGSPLSFSEDAALVEAYWCLDKAELLDRILPVAQLNDETQRKTAETIFKKLQDETGVIFRSEVTGTELRCDEAGRFGNFEIVRYVSGDIRRPDGLCYVLSPADNSIIVWVEPPLSNHSNLVVNCRLFNGGIPQGPTCILNEIQDLIPGRPIKFMASEPYSGNELSVWSDGKLVAEQRNSVIRSIFTNMTVKSPDLRVRSKWTMGFPDHLHERAETVRRESTVQSTVGSPLFDPWRDAERQMQALMASRFPSAAKSRFFLNAQESTLDAMDFLTELLLRPNVQKVTIVDPYFDQIGVESLLVRLSALSCEVRVVASHGEPAAEDLKTKCEDCRAVLPPRMRLINIHSAIGGNGEQFHDRYVVIEMDDAHRVVWMLSNSLSSFAVRYPLIVTLLDQQAANRVSEYTEAIVNQKLLSHPHMRSTLVWENGRKAHPVHQPKDPLFSGSAIILEALVPEAPPDDRLRIAVQRQYVTQGPPNIDWHIPPQSLDAVLSLIKKSIVSGESAALKLAAALGQWRYRGGPSVADYKLSTAELDVCVAALKDHVTTRNKSGEPGLLLDSSMSGALKTVEYLIDQPALDIRNRPTPEMSFLAEVLWRTRARDVVQILDESGDDALFSWICTEGSIWDSGAAIALLNSNRGAPQAAGLFHLHHYLKRKHPNSPEPDILALLAQYLTSIRASRPEFLLAMIYMSSRFMRRDTTTANPFTVCAAFWASSPLPQAELEKIFALLDVAAPYSAVPLAALLADQCPAIEDASALRKLCIDCVVGLAHPGTSGEPINPRVWAQEDTPMSFAQVLWRLHGTAAPEWFIANVTAIKHFQAAREPLLRSKNYSRWSQLIEGFLIAMSLAKELERTAPSEDQKLSFYRSVVPSIAKTLLALGSEIWHLYSPLHDRLSETILLLAAGTRHLDRSECADIELLAFDESIPGVWRLQLLLASSGLVCARGEEVRSLASAPSTHAGLHRVSEIREKADRLIADADRLAAENSDLAPIVNDIKERLAQWRDQFPHDDEATTSS